MSKFVNWSYTVRLFKGVLARTNLTYIDYDYWSSELAFDILQEGMIPDERDAILAEWKLLGRRNGWTTEAKVPFADRILLTLVPEVLVVSKFSTKLGCVVTTHRPIYDVAGEGLIAADEYTKPSTEEGMHSKTVPYTRPAPSMWALKRTIWDQRSEEMSMIIRKDGTMTLEHVLYVPELPVVGFLVQDTSGE